MGKKKRALENEIARLNAQKPAVEITSFRNRNNQMPSVAAVLGSAMTGYKTSYGPSMCGNAYNYKGINTCGPSMKVDLKAMPGLQTQTQTASITPLKKRFGDGIKRKVSNIHYEAKKKLDDIEGRPGGAGTKKMLRETALSAGVSGLSFGVSVIQGRRATQRAAQTAFRNRFASKSSGSSPTSKTPSGYSYGASEKKYSRGVFG